jgi:phosphoglucomutase
VELLVGASLGVLLTGFMMGMVIQVVKEQRRELVDATLQYKADDLEEKLARLIRSMSANETIILGDPLSSGSPFYRRIIVAMGQTPTYARQQLIYDPTAMTLTQDPDITMSSNEILLFKSTPMAKLRNMYFFTSVKSDGVADSSALNIYLQFDDDGFAGRKNPNGTLKRSQVTRYFTVKMRNN